MKTKIGNLLFSLLKRIGSFFPTITIYRTMLSFLSKFEDRFGYFLSITYRPSRSDQIKLESIETCEELAIILQGPLLLKHDFTLETIKIYEKLFPKAFIILSTWKDQDRKTIEKIKAKTSAHIIQSQLPTKAGLGNINFQLVSTVNGIKLAKDKKLKYVIKSRTDQRIYKADVFSYLKNLQQTFPLKDGIKSISERLIVTSLTTLKYRPYCISDMFMFGKTEDMFFYWNAPFDERDNKKTSLNNNVILDSKMRIGETYLTTSFIERIGGKLDWTIKDSTNYYVKYFCLVDYLCLDLFWPKYNYNKENRYNFYRKHAQELFSHIDWISHLNNSTSINSDNIEYSNNKEIGF